MADEISTGVSVHQHRFAAPNQPKVMAQAVLEVGHLHDRHGLNLALQSSLDKAGWEGSSLLPARNPNENGGPEAPVLIRLGAPRGAASQKYASAARVPVNWFFLYVVPLKKISLSEPSKRSSGRSS